MDPRVRLLKTFYRGLPKDRVKVETEEHGFTFLERLLKDGIELEYGELTLSGVLHKYKLARVPEERLDALLQAHVEKTCNVCLYFGDEANEVFCFNLDNNSATKSRVLIPEMERCVGLLRERLRRCGCEPLVIASGRGYHVWGRLEEAVPNDRLYDFMLRAGVAAVAALEAQGMDHRLIKFNFYPDPRTHHVVSLRLFGSLHARNKVFSRVLAPEGLLEEEASWNYFAEYAGRHTLSVSEFEAAYAAIISHGRLPAP